VKCKREDGRAGQRPWGSDRMRQVVIKHKYRLTHERYGKVSVKFQYNLLSIKLDLLTKGIGGVFLMIYSYDETNKSCLKYLSREILLIFVAAILMALPCLLCGYLILRIGD
jgi:hypothetical protein